jgi:hypothetical protein
MLLGDSSLAAAQKRFLAAAREFCLNMIQMRH